LPDWKRFLWPLTCHPERAGASAEATRDQREAIWLGGEAHCVKSYWVYILSGRTRTLYVGVTNDLERRDYEHKNKLIAGFTSKYRLDRLVYFEQHTDIRVANEREKQIKSWRREKKLGLIESINPKWSDLSLDWASELTAPEPEGKSLRVDPSTTRQKTAALVGMTEKGLRLR